MVVRLGHISGIKILVHGTFFILVAFIIIQNAYLGQHIDQILWVVAFVLALFVCVLLHELGHALTARRFGVRTRNIFIWPLGGMALMETTPQNPRQELLVAIAGPLVNLAIAGILFFILSWFPSSRDNFDLSHIEGNNFINTLFFSNLILALFNMIPAFPMDGGRVLRALLSFKLISSKATQVAVFIGQVLAIFLVVIGIFYNVLLLLIGFFIFVGAQAEAKFTETLSLLQGYYVYDVTVQNFRTVEVNHELSQVVNLMLNEHTTNFLVLKGELVVGTLSRNEIIKALSKKGSRIKIGQIMNRHVNTLDMYLPLEEAYQQLQHNRMNMMPVTFQEQLQGIVNIENIQDFIIIKNAEKAATELSVHS